MNLKIYNTKYWEIYLSSEQYYLGRCVVVLKRECGELSGLTEEEFSDFLGVIKNLERALKKAFGTTMFNWTCMMNNAYKEENNENPRVHFHMRPRYKDRVKFAGIVFEDKEFGHHYKRKAEKEVSEDVLGKIVERIRESFENENSWKSNKQ